VTSLAGKKDVQGGAHTGAVEMGLLISQQSLKRLEPAILFGFRDLPRCFRGWRSWALRILEAVGLGETNVSHQFQRGLEIGFSFAGVADDEKAIFG
jgi:hypothetical protein